MTEQVTLTLNPPGGTGQWTVTNTAARGPTGKVVRRPAGLSDFAWTKLATAFCAELNSGAGGVSWIPWGGGPHCPADGQDRILVKFRDGGVHVVQRGTDLRWAHARVSSDIVAYCPLD